MKNPEINPEPVKAIPDVLKDNSDLFDGELFKHISKLNNGIEGTLKKTEVGNEEKLLDMGCERLGLLISHCGPDDTAGFVQIFQNINVS